MFMRYQYSKVVHLIKTLRITGVETLSYTRSHSFFFWFANLMLFWYKILLVVSATYQNRMKHWNDVHVYRFAMFFIPVFFALKSIISYLMKTQIKFEQRCCGYMVIFKFSFFQGFRISRKNVRPQLF